MKIALRFTCAATLLLVLAAGSLRAQDTAAAPPAMAGKNGYTVTVDVKVDEKGKTQSVSVVSTDDASTGDFLTKMAITMAMKTELPPREKAGKPVKYTARVPFFFPIADDEGAAANELPKPALKNAVQPVYPTELRDAGVVGGAIMELQIDATGKLTKLTTLRASHPKLEASAREALAKWEFAPAQKDGQPVESRSRIAMVFETEDKMAELEWRVPPRPSLGAFMVIRPDGPIDERMFDEAAEDGAPASNAAPAAAEPAK